MKNTYIFDFDGTLVDSMPCWSQQMLNILERYNIDYPDDIIKIITPLGNIGTARYFREVLGVPISYEEMQRQMDEYAIPKYRYEIEIKEGVKEYLELLKSKGCSLNVLTASPHRTLDPCLKRLRIYDIFDNVWSCDDFGTTKSDPEIYLNAVNTIGCSIEDVVFFDDNIGALKTAKQAGLTIVGVYDASAEDFTNEVKEVAYRYINSFSELNGPIE